MIVRCDDSSNSRECIITRRYTRHRGHVSTIKIGQCSSQLFSVKSHNILDSCSHCTDQWTNSRVSIGYQEISGIFYNESARIYLSRLWTRQLFSGCLPPVHTCFLARLYIRSICFSDLEAQTGPKIEHFRSQFSSDFRGCRFRGCSAPWVIFLRDVRHEIKVFKIAF